jgi:hypothetical protein
MVWAFFFSHHCYNNQMSRGLVTGIYYAVIVLLLAVPWALGHFFNVVVSLHTILF